MMVTGTFAKMVMKISKQTRYTLIFLAFLLLAGCAHMGESISRGFPATFFFCADFLIYTGLILFWIQSVRDRLLPSAARTYIIAAAILMIFFLVLQAAKYRLADWSPDLMRYCWYGYYIPMLLVPALFLMSSLSLRNLTGEKHSAERRGKNHAESHVKNRGDRRPDSRKELLLLLPAAIAALGVVTNDFHYLAFRPKSGITELTGRGGTYTYGILYYVCLAMTAFMVLAGLGTLFASFRKRAGFRSLLQPVLMIVAVAVLILLERRMEARGIPHPYNPPEIFIFCAVGLIESCIRGRLIPYNENYSGFFRALDLPVMITDRSMKPEYMTGKPVKGTRDELRVSIGSSVYTDPDTRLSGTAVRGGYVFYSEDESALHRMEDALREANELLSMENEILQRERELDAEKAGIEERNRLYRAAAQAVYPAQKRISELLSALRPGTPAFREGLSRVLVLTAYVKRRANFVMREAERKMIPAEELSTALKESVHYLNYCGMHADINDTASREFSCRESMAVYDCFEAAAEALLGNTEELWVRLSDDGLLVLSDGEKLPVLKELPLPLEQSLEDGQLTLRFRLGGDPG